MRPGDLVTCSKSPHGGVVVYRTPWESDIIGTLNTGETAVILECSDSAIIGDFGGRQIKVLISKSGKMGWNFERCFDLIT